MSPHFLCCLPIRLGAFLVALVELPISFIVAALCWYAIYVSKERDSDFHLSTSQYIGFGILGAGYSLMFFAALFGLVGVLSKKLRWIKTFKTFMNAFLLFHIASAVLNIIFFFVNKNHSNCVLVNSDGTCDDAKGLSKAAGIAIVLVLLLVPLLIQAYGCWIISGCVKYLESKDVAEPLYPFASGYVVAPKEEHYSLGNGRYNYSGYSHA